VRVLDLFAGLKGWSGPWAAHGHETFTIDHDQRFDVDAHLDINDARSVLGAVPWKPDVVLASPPCEGFTVMNIGKNWFHDGTPKTDTARQALALVQSTLLIIESLAPRYFVIENPRGKLRALPPLRHLDRRTVTYCQLGEQRMKPTDLWGGFPPSLTLPKPCNNGDPCHVSAPRGSRTPGSTQGISGAPDRAKVPEALSLLVMRAAEEDIARRGGQPIILGQIGMFSLMAGAARRPPMADFDTVLEAADERADDLDQMADEEGTNGASEQATAIRGSVDTIARWVKSDEAA
jgi:hypothetical protein